MTREERAENWFRGVSGAESVGMDAKMAICDKAAKKMALIFFIVLALECAAFFAAGGSGWLDKAAGFLNSLSEGGAGVNHRKGLAIIGGLICLPAILLPVAAAVKFRRQFIKSEAAKAVGKQ